MTSRQISMASWMTGGMAALAGAAMFNHGAARAAEKQHPQIGHTILINGVQLHYTDTGGTGDPIILIHGNGSLVQDFVCSGLVERLAATHRVLAFDRPGYGYTSRPDDQAWTSEAQAELLAAATRQLGVVQPVLVGHSWGTLVALAWALDYPDEVAAVALLSGYYYPTVRPDALALKIANVPVVGAIFTNSLAPIQARITGPLGLKQMFAPADVAPAFKAGMPFGLMLRPSQIRASAEDGAQMPANAERLADRYGELRLPIVVMWGEGDKLVKQDGQSQRLVTQLASAEGKPTPGVGHMIHHSRPDAVAEAILALAAKFGSDQIRTTDDTEPVLQSTVEHVANKATAF